MGKLSKGKIGLSKLPSDVIMVAGNTPVVTQKKIIKLFSSCELFVDAIAHYYIVTQDKKKLLIIFGVYGASMSVDILHVLKDGGCKNIVFVGYAYGNFDLPIGSIVLPNKVLALESLLHLKNLELFPNHYLYLNLKRLLTKSNTCYTEGISVSVPSVFHQPADISDYINNRSNLAFEMELSSVLYYSQILEIRSAGILIINENNNFKIYDKTKAKSIVIHKLFSLFLTK